VDLGLERHRHARDLVAAALDGRGPPVGVMLAGRPAEEELLLSLAAQIEAAAPWRDRHPRIW
jgi:Asp-tRNA(Asn)/Glu-tRNA(Gln) amidotransferase A subunit family amidase